MNQEQIHFPHVESIDPDSIPGAAAVFRVALTETQVEMLSSGLPAEQVLREYLRALVEIPSEFDDSWDPQI